MTKERKAAIEQWEKIKDRILQDGIFDKPDSGYDWWYNCWFCNYIRLPYLRVCEHPHDNGCCKCPLWKWADAHNGESFTKNDCGCSGYYNTLYYTVTDNSEKREKRIEACDLIIAALKGEHIWEAE